MSTPAVLPAAPIVAAAELGAWLRERRTAVGLTSTKVAQAAGCTPQYVTQLETARRATSAQILERLLDILEVSEHDRGRARTWRVRAAERGPLADFSKLFPTELLRFFHLESAAGQIATFSGSIIPGLLQTATYAEAVIRAGGARIRQADVERRVDARRVRQRRLDDSRDPVALLVVLTELAVRQEVGGAPVLSEQLVHLLDRIDTMGDRLDLRIIPYTNPGHPVLGAPTFHLLEFDSALLDDVVYYDTVPGIARVDDPSTVHEHRLAHLAASAAALSTVDSRAMITSILSERRR